MPLVTTTTPNMLGGVSQQPAELRFPEQCEEQENALATVIEGLHKRPHTEHLGVMGNAPSGVAYWHLINRSSTERYAVGVSNGDLDVYNFTAPVDQVHIHDTGGDRVEAADLTYLATATPDTDIECLTVGDFTWVLNKAIQPKMKSATSPARNKEALVFVKTGNYSTEYKITLSLSDGGSESTVSYTTKDSSDADNEPDIQTSNIAAALEAALTGDAGFAGAYGGVLSRSGDLLPTTGLDTDDWTVTREGSVIHIQRDDSADFRFSVEDSVGNTNLIGAKDSIQTFAKLPTTAPNGFTVKIEGEPDQSLIAAVVGYYVKFETTDEGDFAQGIWEETIAPGIEYQLDPTTMPHLLIRKSDLTFLWTPADGATRTQAPATAVDVPGWTEQAAGDATTNPRPDFAATSAGADGNALRGISFFQDRLVLISGETTTFSESGAYFNFFRTSVTDLLDTARLSVIAAHPKVSLLNHAVPQNDQLLVFSQLTQFVIRGGQDGTLTPKNVYVTSAGEWENIPTTTPVSAQNSVFFPALRGNTSLVREMFDQSTSVRTRFSAPELTAQIPAYIQGTITKLAVSQTEDALAVLASGATNTIYCYKWFINGDRRTQSSWCKFTLGGTGTVVKHIEWIDQELYVVTARTTGSDSDVSLERLDFEPYLVDTDSDFRVRLDRRVINTDLTIGSYNSGANTTTVTLPYAIPAGSTMQAVTRESGDTDAGVLITVSSSTTGTPSGSGGTLVLSGDHTSTPFWVGEQYTMNYTFSKIVLQSGTAQGAPTKVTSGSFRLRHGTVVYAGSGYFKMVVTPTNGSAYNYEMSGIVAGDPEVSLGSVTLDEGEFKFPVMGDHEQITIAITNDSPLPSRFLMAEWEALYHTRTRRIRL